MQKFVFNKLNGSNMSEHKILLTPRHDNKIL